MSVCSSRECKNCQNRSHFSGEEQLERFLEFLPTYISTYQLQLNIQVRLTLSIFQEGFPPSKLQSRWMCNEPKRICFKTYLVSLIIIILQGWWQQVGGRWASNLPLACCLSLCQNFEIPSILLKYFHPAILSVPLYAQIYSHIASILEH